MFILYGNFMGKVLAETITPVITADKFVEILDCQHSFMYILNIEKSID